MLDLDAAPSTGSQVDDDVIESLVTRRLKRDALDIRVWVEQLDNLDQADGPLVPVRVVDVYALGTAGFRERLGAGAFQQRWLDAVAARGPLTGFDILNSGSIDIGFVPGLEEVPQDDFVAFLQLVFSTPTVPLVAENAFVVGVVLLREDGVPRIGALHAR